MSKSVHILAVGAESDGFGAMVQWLESAGVYSVSRAASGEEALSAIRRQPPEVVLLARELPDVNGVDICRTIKSDQALADIFVVMYSSARTEKGQAEVFDAGADGDIGGALGSSELFAQVTSYIRISSLTRALRLQSRELAKTVEDLRSAQLAALNLMEDAVAARDRAERALQELHQVSAILQAAMDQSSAGIAVADAPGGVLRYMNDAGLHICGGDRQRAVDNVGLDQYVARWQLMDLNGNPLERDDVPLARAVLYGETCSREFIIHRAPGDDRIVFGNATPVKDQSGRVVAGVIVFTDITERKRAEMKVVEQLTELQRWNSITVGRECRILELKKEVNDLLAQRGEPPHYASVAHSEQSGNLQAEEGVVS